MPRSKTKRGGACKTRVRKSSYSLKWTIEEFSKIQNGIRIRSDKYSYYGGCNLQAAIKKYIPDHPVRQVSDNLPNPASPRKMMETLIYTSENCLDWTGTVAVYNKDGKMVCKLRVEAVAFNFQFGCKFQICLKPDCGSYDLESIEGDVVTFVFSMRFKMIITKTCKAPYLSTFKSNGLDNLSRDFKKLYNSSVGSDIVFKVKGVSFPAHKIILIFRSEYFNSMFSSNMKETGANEVEVNGIEPNVFKYILGYLYTGNIPDIDFGTAYGLYSAAHMYCLSELCQLCKNKLLAKLSADNAHELLSLADLQNDKDMLKQIVEFIEFNKPDIQMTDYVRKTLAREISGAELKDLMKDVLRKTV